MNEIVFIMGKSASGKDKIYKTLVEDFKGKFKTVTMYTTRPMRVGEKEGVEYHFVDDEKALEFEKAGKVIELRAYDTVYGLWKYFTADDGQIDLTKKDRYIIIGTLEAYEKFLEFYGKEHLLPIYIEVDDDIRLTRAIKREKKQEKPNYEELCRRFLADAKDFNEENIKRAGIEVRFQNNTKLEDCIKRIEDYILAN
ncbi:MULTISPECIES: guanylate kinase [Lachnospira]|jgi:guanylate kinase|uniref:Guanylate kinase n=2 Tax=Lachnospira TaxID=28050 RepID=A0A1H5WKH5_9FIRM|nr:MULTISPECIES: guanylate kinase [Lachnospira]SDN29659.1 Guanylate kinase [Lachnospira pectinoschiza]SEF99427.1 Guanylate kinase [Lachnospira multipara]